VDLNHQQIHFFDPWSTNHWLVRIKVRYGILSIRFNINIAHVLSIMFHPEPMVPSYLPPANLHPPSMVLIISASLWMKNQTLKAIHLSKNNARPFLGSKLNNDSVFNVGPKTGEIKSLSGKVLQLATTSKQKETGWNFIPYTLRDLGNGIAFQLQQYNKKLAVIPGVDVTTLHSADSYSLDSVWFVLGV
jgi:hypothetical protein